MSIALEKVKAGNTSESFLFEIRQIIHFLYQLYIFCINYTFFVSLHKKNTQKSTQQYNEFNTDAIQNAYSIYACKNSKSSDPHRLILNLADKMNLNRRDNVALSNLSF